MKQMKQNGEFHSRVYTERPAYADLPAPEKFQAILGIIGTRLRQHPNAICNYSGGSDSDILIDLLEDARDAFGLEPIKYCFFNTGLEMDATKRHVKEIAERYGVEITEYRPAKGKNIVLATRKYGQPFMSKLYSARLNELQRHQTPFAIAYEYINASEQDKTRIFEELNKRYKGQRTSLGFLCSCNNRGYPINSIQTVISNAPYLLEFIVQTPPKFQISAKCCDCCKKSIAHKVQKGFDMIITGERKAEGGVRSIEYHHKSDIENETMCFQETSSGQFRFRPLYYVSDADKEWYKRDRGIRYSDAYEVYGLTRTGCCGCSISSKAVSDLEKIRPYEPQVVKAAWNIFGDSYRYRQAYEEFKRKKRQEEQDNGQIRIF